MNSLTKALADANLHKIQQVVKWIAGFAAIEMNVSEWHDELVGQQEVVVIQG
jgi:hypothetical protein